MLRSRFSRVLGFAAVGVLAMLAGCSRGCGNCTVPPINPIPPGVVVIPGVVPTPTPRPVIIPPTPTPTPIPIPPAPLSCNQGAASVAFGPALAPFALLASTTITNVGNTLVTFAPQAVTPANAFFPTGTNDDLVGVSPGSAITGFPPGRDSDPLLTALYGAGFNSNAALLTAAQNALTVAYNAVVAKAPTVVFATTPDLSQTSTGVANCGVTGNLVCPPGTFGAGIYKFPTTASIAIGNLTLDGGGNPQSVFIFQIGTALTTVLNGGIGGNVLLINSASQCNIYWAEGSAATLGGATFNGNVLTGPIDTGTESITINATTFNGRALAKTAITIPVAGGSTITNPGGN